MSLKEKVLGLPKYLAATSFLAMEVFAFIAFSFGSSFVLYGSLTLALMLILILFSIHEIKVRGITDIIYMIFPLIIFSIVTSIGVFMRGHVYLGDFTVADQVFIPISLLSTVMCGYLLAINKTFSIKIFLITIYSTLGLLVFINLLANLINFGPFYTLIYKGYYMYYAGKRSSVAVNEMAYTLQGLKIVETTMSHYVLYPALLFTSAFMLYKVSPKSQKKEFVLFACLSGLALLSLLLVPSKIGLIAIIFISLIAAIIFIYKYFPATRKPFRIIMAVGIIGASLLFLFMLINNQSFASGIRNLVASNSFLNKLFNTNGFVKKYNDMLYNVLGNNFLSFVAKQEGALTPVVVKSSGSIFFDTFMTGGVLGVVTLSFVAIYSLKCFKKYILEDQHEERIKLCLLAIVIFYFLFCALFYNAEYGIYYYFNTPYFMTGPFIIVMFIFSYVASRKYLNVPVKEKKETKEEEVVKDVENQ